VSRPNAVSRPADERDRDAGAEPRPESSPWWPITLILGEIAEIVERRRAAEHAEEEAAA
jgi:hypothetical protein